ncbi:MAG: hemerythrin domain-containing protein, partial [Acidobacteria bacterium]
MKRDIRLHGLTSDHLHALVLSRRIREAAARGRLDSAPMRRYETELSPHFAVEEDELLPALCGGGRQDLVVSSC